ncbi:TPA: cyclic nucleotide-binding domain-containing protein [Pseudomonas aeruginosa]
MIDLVGHASFLLTFLSFFQRSMVKLRLWAIAAGVVGLTYNSWVHFHMPEGTGIWPVLLWMSVFLVQNIVLAVLQIRGEMEVGLRPSSRGLMCTAFPSMHSRDWAALMSKRREVVLTSGDVLLKVGGQTECLMLLAEGRLDETRADGRQNTRSPGAMFGELTFVLGRDEFNSSPCRVSATSERALVYTWDYDTLGELAKSSRFKAALEEGFVRSAGLKHGLLNSPESPSPIAA